MFLAWGRREMEVPAAKVSFWQTRVSIRRLEWVPQALNYMCNYFICGYLAPAPVIDSAAGGYPSETCWLAVGRRSAMQASLRVSSYPRAERAGWREMTRAVLRQPDYSVEYNSIDEKGQGGARGKQERSNWG